MRYFIPIKSDPKSAEMKTIILFVLSLFILFGGVYAQNNCDLNSYYNNRSIFRLDSTYNDVEIDGKHFVLKVLSDKVNEYMEPYEEPVDSWENYAPKTLVFYDKQTAEIAFAKKFDIAIPEIEKMNGDLSKSGKLFLRWFSSGGGSGYLLDSYYVHLDEGRIVIDELFTTNELTLIFHHKNDSEIYVMQGIWDMTEDEITGDFETHFDQHKFEVFVFRFENDEYVGKSLGVTTNKYYAFDEDNAGEKLMKDIKQKEKILPANLKVEDLMVR